MKRVTPLLLLALLTCACVDIEVNTRINTDGTGVQNWKFTTTALLGSEIRKKMEKNPFFDPKRSKIFDEYKEGDYILRAEVPFENPKDLKDRDRSVAFEKTGFFRRTYTYSETWKRSSGDAGLLAEHTGSMIPVTMKVSVEMPGKIITSNADSVDGSIARWSVPVADLLGSRTLEVKSQNWNYWIILPLAVMLLFATGGAVMLLLDREKKLVSFRGKITCPQCHSAVSAGSAFCNSCGVKLQQT